jgi:uncharacterized protein (DUF885 family)
MLKTPGLLVALGLAVTAYQTPDKPPAAAATIALADEMVAAFKRHVPELGTYLGLPDADHGRIVDNSLDARAKRRVEEDQFLKKLKTIDEQALAGRPEWVIHGFIREALETSIGNRVCEAELWSVDQMGGWQAQYGQLAQIQPIDTEPLQQQALVRFRGLVGYADNEIANLREGLRRGYSSPRGNVQHVITQMDGFAADSSPYFGPAERTTSQPFAAAWREMVKKDLVPAFRRYQTFLRDEYLPRAREAVGVSALPDGSACYKARLREMTTMAVTAEEVHKTGLEELERIKTSERAIAERFFKTSDLDAAFAQLEQPQYKWDNRDAVIAQARKAAERAADAMPQWFGRIPRTKVIVTPIPLVEEPTAADRYQAGTIDGKRPGEYQINAGKWIGNRKSDLEAIVFHETIPGHHLEVSLSRERPDAHLITKIISTSAFSEAGACMQNGWRTR